MTLVDVILPYAVEGSFTYFVPSLCEQTPVCGQRVVVPLGQKKLVTGIIEHVREAAADEETDRYRAISYFPESFPMVTSEQLRLWHRMSEYYMCTLGEVMRAALPGQLRIEKESRPRKKARGPAKAPRTGSFRSFSSYSLRLQHKSRYVLKT